MPRTTIDLDPVVLHELKRLQEREGKSLGRLVSDLLAGVVGKQAPQPSVDFRWHARPMGARIDLDDGEALRRALVEDR